MADFMTPVQRGQAMSKVRGTDSRIEVLIRSALHRKGFRFRKNVKELPGSPDVVLKRYGCAIFVNGCFWHGHTGCPKAALPKTATERWTRKIRDTIARDGRQIAALRQLGWRVRVVWECSLRSSLAKPTIGRLCSWVRSVRGAAMVTRRGRDFWKHRDSG